MASGRPICVSKFVMPADWLCPNGFTYAPHRQGADVAARAEGDGVAETAAPVVALFGNRNPVDNASPAPLAAMLFRNSRRSIPASFLSCRAAPTAVALPALRYRHHEWFG
jgi:hypothetical protein